ncbi:F-box/kelch-repeat protein At3g23880-like [Apium graveolens]|uniref:F-box/kelch-repeat protein At3g23880-like n=1 Tax=Apium graveolens TaxID=4045 RepID=UPI003D7B6251
MAADYSSLPDEIVEQIFKKTQCIKSIVTCTCVCKSWHALITTPGSMNMHSLSPDNNNGITYYLVLFSRACIYSMQYYDGRRLKRHYDLVFPHKNFEIVGCCNGLICYTEFRYIYLWNPAIRKLKVVPDSGLYYDEPVVYGFWFDVNTDDYKVAKISCTERSKIEVYSLSSNSWDVITTTGPGSDTRVYKFDSVVHVNGTLYWLICRKGDWNIISFDMKNGTFQENIIENRSDHWSSSRFVLLAAGDNSHFFFVLRFKSFSYRICNVWVYEKISNKPYMTEFKVCKGEQLPIGVKNNSHHEVLFQSGDGYGAPISVSNHRDSEFRRFSLLTRTIDRIRPFTETLVLLNDRDSSSTTNTQEA